MFMTKNADVEPIVGPFAPLRVDHRAEGAAEDAARTGQAAHHVDVDAAIDAAIGDSVSSMLMGLGHCASRPLGGERRRSPPVGSFGSPF